MAGSPSNQADTYLAYRTELHKLRMSQHVRVGAAVGFGINAVFVGLDFVLFEDRFWPFLCVRLVMAATLVWTYFRESSSRPRLGEALICISLGGGMLTMIYADGPSSRYYAGLVLLFCGMGVILPLTATEALWICGAIMLCYLGVPAMSK